MGTNLEAKFNAAADYVAAAVTGGQPGFTDAIKLQLYGLYKQATTGACQAKQPAFWNMAGRAKWDAWHRLGNMPAGDAMQQYITVLGSVTPSWCDHEDEDIDALLAEDDRGAAGSSSSAAGQQQQQAGAQRGGARAAGGFGPVFSMHAREDASEQDPEQGGAHHLHEVSGQGDEQAVAALLQAGTLVDVRDDEGCTPLHFAADRGQAGTARLLLDAGADVNAQDNDGASPLHYATLCGNKELAALLLEHGANPQLQDSSGQPALPEPL